MCVGWWESPGTGYCAFVGVWSLLWKYLDQRNEADKAPGALPKLANLPQNIDCPKVHPQMKGTSTVFSPDDKPDSLKKPGGSWRAAFHLCDQWHKGLMDWRLWTMMVVWTECEWAGCVSCLPLFVSQCFWLITLPSFPLSSCQTTGFFFFLEGHPPLLPIPFLYQPTPLSPAGICCPHICIMCQSCTPNPNPLFEHTHTHKLTQMKSHKLVLRTILLIFETPIASIYQSVLCRSNMVDFLHSGCQFVKS